MDVKTVFNKKNLVKVLMLGAVGGVGALGLQSALYERRVNNAFTDAVEKDKDVSKLVLEAGDVTLAGPVERGISFDNNRANPNVSCWISDLKVVSGEGKLPYKQKVLGSDLHKTVWSDGSTSHQGCILPALK